MRDVKYKDDYESVNEFRLPKQGIDVHASVEISESIAYFFVKVKRGSIENYETIYSPEKISLSEMFKATRKAIKEIDSGNLRCLI